VALRKRFFLTFCFCFTQLFANTDTALLSGKFNPDKKAGFKVVPKKYVLELRQMLDERALEAFLKMAAAAEKAGFKIRIVSGTRNFGVQKVIWEQKFTGARKVGGENIAKTIPNEEKRALEILRFSSMPGTSRHHWGTDMDLHELAMKEPALYNKSFKNGRGLEFYNWMVANAPTFGFCQPYTGDPSVRHPDGFAHGYQEERWHWSYKPVSSQYLSAYKAHAAALSPTGFAGDKAGGKFYMDYVFNVDPSCY